MFRFDGKAALVTGASGGIGSAIARALHTQGAAVVLSGTRRDALDSLAAELGERAHVCPADLADPAAADALVEAAEKAAGPLAILVNNAGLTRDGLALRMRDEDWQAVLDVDLAAPFRLARASLRGMLRRRAGRIINIGSTAGFIGDRYLAVYSAAKGGVHAFTRVLALELGESGITVNAIAPYGTRSDDPYSDMSSGSRLHPETGVFAWRAPGALVQALSDVLDEQGA